MTSYRIGDDWSRHGEVVKRVHPEQGQPTQTPALDEIVKWVLDRLTDEEINQRRSSEGSNYTPLEGLIVFHLSWEHAVNALEELWELRGPCDCEYIDAATRQNPMLMFRAFGVLHKVLGPRDILNALLVTVIRARINMVGRAAFWDNSLTAQMNGRELYG